METFHYWIFCFVNKECCFKALWSVLWIVLAINLKMIDTFVRGAGLKLTSNLCRLCQETIKAKTKCRVSLQKMSFSLSIFHEMSQDFIYWCFEYSTHFVFSRARRWREVLTHAALFANLRCVPITTRNTRYQTSPIQIKIHFLAPIDHILYFFKPSFSNSFWSL